MILMASVQNFPEALEADKGGADIIDVKNLQEALVGSAEPGVVKQIRDAIDPEKHVSLTLGVVPKQVGTVAMAVYAAGAIGATSVKVGFLDHSYDLALEILQASKRALEGTQTKLIGSLFADNHLFDGGLDPHRMNELAKGGECDGWLIDTLTKDGRNLFNFVPEPALRDMVMEGKEHGMSTSLSGHLRLQDLDELARCNPDIVGVRGAVCRNPGERETAVNWEAVAHFRKELLSRMTGEVDVWGEGPAKANSGWVVIDGRGKTCAGIIASLSAQVAKDAKSMVEVIIPDVLNTFDVIVWARKNSHTLLSQRNDEDNKAVRILVQP
ncbi:MAG: hypothetical protein EXR52_04850 [Dehalococcoidia bacterium]|nr:hypothetical protein [Dehalococcoidia bacterium]